MDILNIVNNENYKKLLKKIKYSDLNKDIINGKKLIHILALRGKINVIKKIISKFDKFNIYQTDDEGNTFFHILFINGIFDLNLIYKYPESLEKTNNLNKQIFRFCIDNITILKKIIVYLVKKDSLNTINILSYDNKTLIHDIVDNITRKNNYYNLLEYILENKLNINNIIYCDILFYCIDNSNLLSFNLLIKYIKNLDIKTDNSVPLLSFAIIHDKYKFVKSLLSKKYFPDINNGGLENRYIPLNLAIVNNNNKIIKLLLSKQVNLNLKDRYQNTCVHNLLLNFNKDYDIDTTIKIIIEGDLFIKNSINKRPIDILKENDELKKILKIIKDKYPEILKNGNLDNKNSEKDVNKINNKVNFGLFNSDTVHSMIYTVNFIRKFKNLTVLIQETNKIQKQYDLWKLRMYHNNLSEYSNTLYSLVELYTNLFYNILPHVIIWRSKSLHFIHPNIVYYIQKALLKKYRFILIKITLMPNTSTNHANLLLYDDKRKEIYRFEPYGKSFSKAVNHLDDKIKEIFKKALRSEFKYYSPSDFLNNTSWQTLSNENEDKVLGDPYGYCLAWCYWFLENKLNNPDIDIKVLMEKKLSLITNNNDDKSNKILEEIRQYSHILDRRKNEFMNLINISKNNIYKKSYNMKEFNRIISEIRKYYV